MISDFIINLFVPWVVKNCFELGISFVACGLATLGLALVCFLSFVGLVFIGLSIVLMVWQLGFPDHLHSSFLSTGEPVCLCSVCLFFQKK